MSCFLCDSFHHVTSNCEKYNSDDIRMNILLSKINSSSKFFTLFASKKCYICCSKNHNTFFCPYKSTAPNFFVPNIDHDLLPRFLETLEDDEKEFLALQTPTISKFCKLEPLAIVNTFSNTFCKSIPDEQRNIIVKCKNLEICKNFVKTKTYEILHKKIITKTVTILIENLKLSNIEISSYVFYQLLSSRTKKLEISKVEFLVTLTLDEIFEHAPNLEECQFEFRPWDDHIWQDKGFLKYKYGAKFKKLKIMVNSNFDVTKVAPFMNKGPPNIEIYLFVMLPANFANERHLFLRKVYKAFSVAQLSDRQKFSLYFGIDGQKYNAGSFALKY